MRKIVRRRVRRAKVKLCKGSAAAIGAGVPAIYALDIKLLGGERCLSGRARGAGGEIALIGGVAAPLAEPAPGGSKRSDEA